MEVIEKAVASMYSFVVAIDSAKEQDLTDELPRDLPCLEDDE